MVSAWDIAGAVVWTPLALLMWAVFFHGLSQPMSDPSNVRGCAWACGLGITLSLSAVYCIARLFGAHA